MGKKEKTCKILKKEMDTEFKVERGILNSVKVCFKKPLSRQSRENLNKCLKKNKMNAIWSHRCALIR